MATIQVTKTTDRGAGSLRDAIATAQSGDVIKFSLASGARITLTSGEIIITEGKNLTIDGAGVAKLTISGNNQSRIFNIKSNAASVNELTIKNLILADGVAPSEPPETDGSPADTSQRGGAILSGSSSALNLDNVIFNDNKAVRGGGAIYGNSYSKLLVLNSQFNRNSGVGKNDERAGGAITFRGSDELIVKNSRFIGNKGVNGGAINTVHAKVTIDDSEFINNTSDGVYDPSQPATDKGNPKSDSGKIRGYGGAVYIDSAHERAEEPTGYARIYRSVFEGNKGKGAGGAAYIYTVPGDKVIIDSSTFENNQVKPLTIKPGAKLPYGYVLAPGNGGGLNQTSNAGIGANAGFIVTNSTFANNTATNQGGGLWKNVSPTTIVNSTFSGNKARNIHNSTDNSEIGGGLALYGPATITNSTIANNFANWMGGGLAVDNENLVTVSNTIFDDNIANRGGAPTKTGAHTTRRINKGQNNIQFPNRTSASTDFLAVAGIRVIDPKLGPLQYNGGLTKTMALLSGSPAIDAGVPLLIATRDQRGKLRPVDGNGNGLAAKDIGAFEVSNTTAKPEISATLSGKILSDGLINPYNYGQTSVAKPILKTLTISNTGNGTLCLDNLQLPAGFSALGSLPFRLLPGDDASVTIRLNASKSGHYYGEIFIATNDTTQSPFSFAVKGSVIGVIRGTDGTNSIRGLATDEKISALNGNDLIQANAGDDTVYGGSGNDVIAGGVGLNELIGGSGNDSYTLNNPQDSVIETSSSTSGTDIVNVAANYFLPANVENLGLLGTSNYKGSGNSLKNLVTGNTGNNSLNGMSGSDHLRGMNGNDSLAGGAGNDILTGGAGNDRYIYNINGDIGDVISDFRVGQDKIDLSSLLDKLGYSGTNPIKDGYLKFASTTYAGATATRIFVDVDGFGGSSSTAAELLCQQVHISSMNNPTNFVF